MKKTRKRRDEEGDSVGAVREGVRIEKIPRWQIQTKHVPSPRSEHLTFNPFIPSQEIIVPFCPISPSLPTMRSCNSAVVIVKFQPTSGAASLTMKQIASEANAEQSGDPSPDPGTPDADPRSPDPVKAQRSSRGSIKSKADSEH